MASNENKAPGDIFNEYVEKSPNGKVKMSKFYDYVVSYTNQHPLAIFNSQIKLDNTNIKSIYFDDSRWGDLVFEILNSNDIEIIINKQHKMANFTMNNCSDINLIFGLEGSKDGFTNRNNFSFQECKFKMIDIRSALEDKNQFVFNYKLNFSNCEIGEMNRIENKKFNDSLTFKNTIFKKSVNFDGKIFNAYVKFIKCEVKDNISFKDSIFEKETYFQDCTFNEVKVFIESENIIDPNNEPAFSKTDFSNVIFKDNIYFNDSRFNQIFMLRKAQIYKEAHFQNCIFGEIQAFIDLDINVSPNDIVIFNETDFSNATFNDIVYFDFSKFNGAFILEGARFDKTVNFFKTEFNNVFDFTSCLFREAESINFVVHKIDTNIKTLRININEISKQEVEKRIQKNEIKKRI